MPTPTQLPSTRSTYMAFDFLDNKVLKLVIFRPAFAIGNFQTDWKVEKQDAIKIMFRRIWTFTHRTVVAHLTSEAARASGSRWAGLP